MKAFDRPASSLAALTSLAAACIVSSCSLPPREAWHMIQQEGLIAFLSNSSLGPAPTSPSRPAPRPTGEFTLSPQSAVVANSPQFVGPPSPAASVIKPQAPVSAPRNIMPPNDKALVAASVPSMPGFVRSPYTTPPRLIDVKGSSPGATMVCPYTQRPFIIPADFVNPPSAVASNPAPAAAPTKPMAQPPTIALKSDIPSSTPPASTPSPTTPPTTTPPTSTPPANALFNNKPANNTPPPASTAAAKPAAPEIPYGMPIPNRPGFVNSPYAAKHQLVDVTGLPAGMEVKCPYTGKLFKVPASDIAEQKAVASPGAPPAPEKPEKK